ncbi:hypothetical protein [Chryseobacterium luteum]|uniref:hypothetical protein n=1 Tax=Chryseobacterium luteum TaxID=421531 RepID=UPI000B09286B|nr:hypothetical protein [Chryseobacterium luteum]
MILIYAYGSGLGHLKRVTSFLKRQNYASENCILLTNSVFSEFWKSGWNLVQKEDLFFSSAEFLPFLENLISENNIHTFIVDVFPTGFYGELSSLLSHFQGGKILLSRILSNSYFDKNPNIPDFDEIFVMEKGIDLSHLRSGKILYMDYQNNISEEISITIETPYYLIIHSQPLTEVIHLYRLAKMYRTNQKVVILTATAIPQENISSEDLVLFQQKPSQSLLSNAEKIFSGAGFNTFHMLVPYHKKWICNPFPRTFDDQFLRKTIHHKTD